MTRRALVPAWLLVAVASLALAGRSVAAPVEATYCRDCPCSGAPEQIARLRTRLAELATSADTLGEQAEATRRRLMEKAARMRGGSLGNFSERFGGMADTREALSSGRTDGPGDLIALDLIALLKRLPGRGRRGPRRGRPRAPQARGNRPVRRGDGRPEASGADRRACAARCRDPPGQARRAYLPRPVDSRDAGRTRAMRGTAR